MPGSELTIKNVGVNPTRTGVLDVLRDMGADITESNFRDEAEPMCDLTVKYSKLHGVEIGGAIIPRLIDELPVIAVAAAFAEGETVIRDAQELKVKGVQPHCRYGRRADQGRRRCRGDRRRHDHARRLQSRTAHRSRPIKTTALR